MNRPIVPIRPQNVPGTVRRLSSHRPQPFRGDEGRDDTSRRPTVVYRPRNSTGTVRDERAFGAGFRTGLACAHVTLTRGLSNRRRPVPAERAELGGERRRARGARTERIGYASRRSMAGPGFNSARFGSGSEWFRQDGFCPPRENSGFSLGRPLFFEFGPTRDCGSLGSEDQETAGAAEERQTHEPEVQDQSRQHAFAVADRVRRAVLLNAPDASKERYAAQTDQGSKREHELPRRAHSADGLSAKGHVAKATYQLLGDLH